MPRLNAGPRLKPNELGYYEIHWTKNGRSRRESTGCKESGPAQAYFGAWLLEQQRDQRETVTGKSECTVGEIVDFYVEKRLPLLRSHQSTRAALNHLRRLLGNQLLVTTDNDVLRDMHWRKREREGVKEPTILRELTMLSAVWRMSRKAKLHNIPVPEYDRPKGSYEGMAGAHHKEVLTADELNDLLVSFGPAPFKRNLRRLAAFCWIGGLTGQRAEAVLQLSWSRVDLKNRMLNFRTAETAGLKKRRVVIAIPDALYPVLVALHRERESDDALLCGNAGEIYSRFVGYVKRNKLGGGKHITPHCLRHTFVTLLQVDGASDKEISDLVAMSPEIIRRVYGHHNTATQRATANRISGILGGPLRTVENPGVKTGRNRA